MPITKVEKARSARVDLFGGTLDIPPLHLILKEVVTLNAALSLKSQIKVQALSRPVIEIISHDYQTKKEYPLSDLTEENIYQKNFFQQFTFTMQILDQFPWRENSTDQGLSIEFTSQIPPGSGLGGSSVMGINLCEVLSDFFRCSLTKAQILNKVKNIEARILDSGPTGYQDYYPALYGGILALKPAVDDVIVEQLFTPALKEYLEEHLSLIYSGQARLSGINNWEVYKEFFDKNPSTRMGLQNLAHLAQKSYQAVINKDYRGLISNLMEEGELREKLFSKIATAEMKSLVNDLKKENISVGLKVCGAGGGGCFLIIFPQGKKNLPRPVSALLAPYLQQYGMKELAFEVAAPL